MNNPEDVAEVQASLNSFLRTQGLPLLAIDRQAGQSTVDAIARFQSSIGMPRPDSLIQVGGRTSQALQRTGNASQPVAAAPIDPARYSGATWWHANQAKWPNERNVDALSEPWRTKAKNFLAALAKAGAQVTVNATTRSMTRAKIMRYCWDISKGLMAPSAAPAIEGVDILWDHGNLSRSRAGATQMVALFAIKKQPSLNSNHLRGTAIDMSISWAGDLTIEKSGGKSETIKTLPRDGMNSKLHAVGETYGVLHKLPDDPPHWSNTGR